VVTELTHELRFDTEYAYPTGDVGILVPVRLSLGDQFIDFDARLDTGASFCIFNRAYGETLGLNIEAGEPVLVGTATGAFDARGHTLTLTTLGHSFDAVIYFALDPAFRRNVLGRRGWLDRVRLGLIDYEGKLYLSKYESEG
jgi:hypothetical protein